MMKLVARAYKELLVLRRHTVVHIHVSQRGSLLREGSLVWVAALRRLPVIVTLHGSSLADARGANRLFVKAAIYPATLVHGFSDIYQQRLGLRRGKFVVIPNGVSSPQSSEPTVKRLERVIFLGEVGPRKGVDILLGAWGAARLTAKLEVAGPLAHGFDFVALSRRPESVAYLGPLAHSTAMRRLAEADLLVLPSRREAFPVVACEAMIRGVAVIGTDVGAFGSLLRSAGQMIVSADQRALTAAFETLLERPEELLALKKRAREYALANLSMDAVSERWTETYVRLRRRAVN